jgi:hypothetical protein
MGGVQKGLEVMDKGGDLTPQQALLHRTPVSL